MPATPHRLVSPLVGMLLIVAALAGCAAASGSADPGAVRVRSARIELPPDPSVAAVRFVVENDSGRSDRLVRVSSPAARSVSVHRSQVNASGLAEMAPVASVPLAARSSVRFRPGGLHVMLTGISQPLSLGDRVPVTFTFERAPSVTVRALVVEPGSLVEHAHDR